MKRLQYIALAMILCFAMIKPTPNAELPVEDFTHAVFAEEFTATWCVYCPSAAENLMKVYEDVPNEPYYEDHFFFVALITDVNDKADDRMGDFPDVTGYPTVIFDGNDEKVSGGQSDTSNYEQAIDTTGQRDDTDISLEIQMDHLGADKLDVTVSMTWNEDATLGNPTFDGFLRAYIVEKVSRYDNYDGDPYHFGFLDYAFEQSVELNPHEELELTTVWTGGDHEDANGDDFSDIDYDNINIFVAFFNDESTASDKYSLQSAFAIPPKINIEPLEGIQGGNIEIYGTATSEKSEIKEVYYRWNENDWVNSGLSTFNGDFMLVINTENIDNGQQELSIKMIDKGASNVEILQLELLNDYDAPNLEVIVPSEGDTVEEVTIFEVEVTDNNQVSEVEYKINEGNWRKMYSSGDDNYIASWNTQEANAGNGDYIITFKAVDLSSNTVTEFLNISVFNEGDVTYPYLEIIEPKEEIHKSMVKVEVETADPEGISEIHFRVDDGPWENLTKDSGDLYDAILKPLADGWHELYVSATDSQGYSTNQSVQFETDMTPPIIILDSEKDITAIAEFNINVQDYSQLQSLRYRILGILDWIDLDASENDAAFTWDSTHSEDGKHLLEIECTDKLGSSNTFKTNLDVKNKGLIHSSVPSNIETGKITKINAVIDYDLPKAVNVVIAKYIDGVCADGVRIPMYKEGAYYHSDLYFEEEGVYLYSIEIDTGHGKLSSYEQNIVVSSTQEIITTTEDNEKLYSPGLFSILLVMFFVAKRKKI